MSNPSAPPVPKRGGWSVFLHSLRALSHRDYRIFWTGAVLTNTGKFLAALAVPIVLYKMTGSAVMVGLVTTFQYLPGVLMGPVGGSLADKFDRRKVIIFAQFGMMASTLLMWLAWTVFHVREPFVILCLVGLIAVFNGITIPGWASFINDLVPRKDLMSGVTLNSLQSNIAKAIGPALAGVLLLVVGADWAFLIAALAYLFVIGALFAIKTVPVSHAQHIRGRMVRQTVDASRYIFSSKGIFVAIVLSVLIGLAGNPIYGFTVVLGADVYGVNEGGVGALNLALGLGAILSAPLAAGLNDKFKMSWVVGGSMLAYGACLAAVGLTDNFVVGMIALAVLGAAALASLSALNTAIQLIVASHLRGRILGLRHVVYTLSFPVGALAQGWIADRYGIQVAILGAGLLMMAIVAVLYVARGQVRMARLDDPHDDQIERMHAEAEAGSTSVAVPARAASS
jgi:MFS family permease